MIEVDIKENEEKDESDNEPSGREVLEAWIAKQGEDVQSMFEEGIAGLTSALQKEREAAKEATRLEKELAEAKQQLDGYKTDEEKALDALTSQLAETKTSLADAETQRDEAIQALIDARISFAVTAEAFNLGFEDPKDAESLLPADAVKYNKKTGKVEGAEDALKKLADDKPYLLGQGDGVGTPRRSRTKRQSSDEKKAPVTGLRI